jgi:hypothetical protein
MVKLGVLPIDNFAWMHNGSMLLVTESHIEGSISYEPDFWRCNSQAVMPASAT